MHISGFRRRLIDIGWSGAFLVLLAVMLFPLILVSASTGHEISIFDQAVLIAIATVVVQILRRVSVWEVTGRPNARWVVDLARGMALGLLLMLIPALLLWLTGSVSFEGTNVGMATVLQAMGTMAGVAIAEELLFRGVLFQRLGDALGPWPAQLIVGALFLLTHLDNAGMTGSTRIWAGTNIFIASLMFGLAFYRTRSLAFPIGIHFMANTAEGIILGFGVSGSSEPRLLAPLFRSGADWLTGGRFGLEASLPGLLVVTGVTVWLARRASWPVVAAREADAI